MKHMYCLYCVLHECWYTLTYVTSPRDAENDADFCFYYIKVTVLGSSKVLIEQIMAYEYCSQTSLVGMISLNYSASNDSM